MVIYLKAFTSFLTFIISYGFGYIPIKYKNQAHEKKSFNHINLFADGIFVGIALLHLLPDALHHAHHIHIKHHIIYLVFFTTIVFFATIPLLLEKIFNESHPPKLHAKIFFILLSIHALLEGFCLGVTKHFETTVLLIFALVIHKGLESFALIINQTKFIKNTYSIYLRLFIFSAMTPVGIIGGLIGVGSFFTPTFLAYFNAITAGTFIYMVLNCQCELNGIKRSDAMFIMLGFSLIALVNVFLQHTH